METEPGDTLDSPQGGSGDGDGESGDVVVPGKGLKDERLERRALLRRWPVADGEKRARMVRRMEGRVLDKETKTRDATQAFRAILSAEAQNMEDEKRAAGPDQLSVSVTGAVLHGHQLATDLDPYRAALAAVCGPAVAGTGAVPDGGSADGSGGAVPPDDSV